MRAPYIHLTPIHVMNVPRSSLRFSLVFCSHVLLQTQMTGKNRGGLGMRIRECTLMHSCEAVEQP